MCGRAVNAHEWHGADFSGLGQSFVVRGCVYWVLAAATAGVVVSNSYGTVSLVTIHLAQMFGRPSSRIDKKNVLETTVYRPERQ